MDRRYFVVILSVFLSILLSPGCSKDDDMMDPGNNTTASFKGSFVASAHATSGTASVDEDKKTLTLEAFKSLGGPDLNIWLASDLNDIEGDYIDLGDIKGLDGDYAYALPDNIDFTAYKYVVVWCITFHINFGYATLAPQ